MIRKEGLLFSQGINALVRLDIFALVCTITRTIFIAFVRMNDVQRTVLLPLGLKEIFSDTPQKVCSS